jgi:hypothetical protein
MVAQSVSIKLPSVALEAVVVSAVAVVVVVAITVEEVTLAVVDMVAVRVVVTEQRLPGTGWWLRWWRATRWWTLAVNLSDVVISSLRPRAFVRLDGKKS